MAHENTRSVFTVQAGGDLTALQYHAIALDDGLRAIHGGEAVGILLGKPKSGEAAPIGFSGIMKYRAGGSITKGNKLTVDSNSTFIKASSGSWLVGRALAACSSGSVGTGMFGFELPYYAVDSASAT